MCIQHDDPAGQHVESNAIKLCPQQAGWENNHLIRTCENCNTFMLHCCYHEQQNTSTNPAPGAANQTPPTNPCHKYRVVYCRGAAVAATADAPAAMGIGQRVGPEHHEVFVLDDASDPNPPGPRTRHRADLLAVLMAIRGMHRLCSRPPPASFAGTTCDPRLATVVVALDSRSVYTSLTEKMPVWKQNNWRGIKVTFPNTLRSIDAALAAARADGVEVAFLLVPIKANNKTMHESRIRYERKHA